MLHIYRIFDLPYQSQIIPLAAILADIPDALEHSKIKEMLVRWYWNGVFGELYSSAVETRVARDFMEVPAWLRGGPEPSTVSETMFRADRLKTMRMRLSAAYKGINALLMKDGAQDLRSGQEFGYSIFFEENVDIHRIFPQDWCKKHKIEANVFDSIINKTPLSCKTNRIIGGVAPSEYLAKLEKGDQTTPPITREKLDDYLRTHLIDPDILRSNQFDAFMVDRQKQLLALIEQATGKAAYVGSVQEEGEENEADEDTVEAALTIPSAGKPVLQDELPPTALRESVLEMGAEGGSVAILRERKAGDVWQFQMKTDESTLYDFLSKEDQGMNLVRQTGCVQSFHEALGLLNDRYPGWFGLYLLKVHPEFLDTVLLEVRKRGGPTEETRWRERLKEIEPTPAV